MYIDNLVSIIIIFLNEEKFIEEAIQSVFEQSYKNWELILVDDGSSDKSVDIAKHYTKHYSKKVKYLEHPGHENLGMSASRNLGILNSKGNYITFLDGDDVWLPEKLEQQVHILNSIPDAAMVYGRTLIWHSWIREPEERQQDYFYDLGVKPNSLINPPNLFLLMLQNKTQTPTTCNIMIRREIFEQVGVFEKNFRSMYEDQVFFSKVLLRFPVFVSDNIWAKYRQHPESCNMIAEETDNYFSFRLPFLNWLLNYLTSQGLNKKSPVWIAAKREFWLCTHPNTHYVISKYNHLKNRLKHLLKSNPPKQAIESY